MPTLELSSSALATLDVDAVVIGVGSGEDGPFLATGAEALDEAFDGRLLDALTALGANGAEDEVVRLATFGAIKAPVVAAVGLGKPDADGWSTDAIRRAAGAATRALFGRTSVALTLGAVNWEPTAALVRAAAEGALLGAYSFRLYRSAEAKPRDLPPQRLILAVADAKDRDARRGLEVAEAVGDAVTLTRDLINTPPNDLYPAELADRAAKAGAAAGLEVEVLDEKKLLHGGYGGILGVGAGSSRPPRLVRLTYNPRKRKAPFVALVGKGITFDSGGISIKPAAGMESMKSDMSGAAAMIASVVLAARLKLPVKVVATVPMAENLPSGTSYRPADVLTFRNKKTAEIKNTDAEGRIILADAIARACEDDPDYLVETSTLTGAQVVALGNRTSGVLGSDEFRDRVVAASRRSGESMWAMPLPADVRKAMDSTVADIANVGERAGGMLAGGHFLAEFVAEGVPWAHIDIAGPAFNTGGPWGYTPKGGTGVPVLTVLALLEDIAENG